MKKIIILCGTILLMSGASTENKAEFVSPTIEDTVEIEIDTVQDKVHKLDSVLKELKKEVNGKHD